MVLANNDSDDKELITDAHLLPATDVGKKAGEAIRVYLLYIQDESDGEHRVGGDEGRGAAVTGGGSILFAAARHDDAGDPEA